MKVKIIFLLCFFIASFSFTNAKDYDINFGTGKNTVKITENNYEKLNISYDFEGIKSFEVSTKKGLFSEISIPKTYFIGEVGTPKLPAAKELIEIPFGAQVSVKVKNYTLNKYKLSEFGITNKIMPAQPSLAKNIDPTTVEFEYNEAAYNSNSFIKHELISVEVLGVLRGVRLARLVVAPVRYNPVTGMIQVYNNIEVEITFTGSDIALTENIKASTYSPYFEAIYKSIINHNAKDYPDHPDLTTYPVKYLIVSDPMFETQLQPFIEWKTKKGFKVIVAYTDVIGTSYSDIQTYIHNQYNAGTTEDPAPSFVLLVGDTPQIPAQTGSASAKMTDLYYCSVDGDNFPEMYYGRLSATTTAQLQPQIDKILYYEKYEFTDPAYLDNVTLIAGADSYGHNPSHGQPTINYATENYYNTAHGFTNINVYLTSYTGCYETVNAGVGFINYTAHGGQTEWCTPELSQTAVNAFTNQGKYPLAIGNCCLACDFGYTECFGETWMRAENKGAVGYIGSSPSSYWDEDVYWSVGAFSTVGDGNTPSFDTTTWGVYDAPFISDYVSMDAMVFIGNLAVTEADNQGFSGSVGPTYYWQAYNCLGDPSLVIYQTQGEINNTSYMDALPIGIDYFEVTAEPGSYVGISKDGVLHGSALVGETGTVNVPITPVLSGGNVDIVITKPQYQPVIDQIPAAALDGAYVVLDNYTIDDASGNNNGLADFNEAVTFDVTLKNLGTEMANAVNAVLSCSDSYVTITDNTHNFGDIDTNSTAQELDAFAVTIANNVPDQYKVTFGLEMTDNIDSTWNSTLQMTINAPELTIGNITIDDSETGNDDGILDPGETANIIISTSNTGHADVTNAIANLSVDNYVTINDNTYDIGDLNADSTEIAIFSVTADALTPMGTEVSFVCDISAGESSQYTAEKTIPVVVGLIPDYFMSNDTITACIGTFYDTGGPDENYSNSENFTMTFQPNSENKVMEFDFTSFETESNDYLHIYNGTNTSADEIEGSPFSGTNSPGIVSASNEQGALTFNFISNSYTNNSGWVASFTCFDITEPPACAGNPNPADGSTDVSTMSSLSWEQVSGAFSYDVYFGTSSTPEFVENVTNISFTPASMEAFTTYYWKVVPKNPAGEATSCSTWFFTTGYAAYLMSDTTITTCSSLFYDTGGPDGQYESSEDITMTFMPSIEGAKMQVIFTEFNVESYSSGCYDQLEIYDGTSTSATQIGTYCGTDLPETVSSTTELGALTFHFTSDGSVTRDGWAATLNCIGGINVAPEFISPTVTSATIDSVYTYNIATLDENADDTLIITCSEKPDWLSFVDNGDGTAILSGTPLVKSIDTIELIVSDGELFDTQSFTITSSETNVAPVFTSIPVTTGAIDSVYTYNIITSDVNASDSLTITCSEKPEWLSFSDNEDGTAILSGTPTVESIDTIELIVSDGELSDTQLFTITSSETNVAPVFTSIPVTTGAIDSVYTYNIITSDVNASDSLIITCSEKPEWLSFSDNEDGTATLSGTPLVESTDSVKLLVSDGELSNTQGFELSITLTGIINNYNTNCEFKVYPNPVNDFANIKYKLSNNSNVNLSVYNILGKNVYQIIANKLINRGEHSILLDSKNLEKGIYFIKMTVNNKTFVKKIVVSR